MTSKEPAYSGAFSATFVVLLASLIAYGFMKLYRARIVVIDLKKKGLPVAPGHSFFFGHLLYLKSMIDSLPKGAHYQYAFGDIARQHFTKEGAFYIDVWPITGLFLIIVTPKAAIQTIQTNVSTSMSRPILMPRFFKPIAGGPNLFDLPENEWRPWRAIFAKGFNAEHTLSLVPGMVKETLVFRETLRNLAQKGDMFLLDFKTLRFTMDLIGKTILNTSLRAQNGYNVLADCMLSQIRWHQPNAEMNPLEYLNIARKFMHWSNGRQMDKYIGKELDKRYKEYRDDPDGLRTKAVIDLVLQAYVSANAIEKSDKLDAKFRAFAISQIRVFIFAGHDSTSSTICYIIHLLATNPHALARLRAEHDEIFGENISAVPVLLQDQPHLTNMLPYTTAVIKEALRLFPPASCTRQGNSRTDIIDDQGNYCPTDDTVVWIIHVEMHRAPQYWKRPDEFVPERWLVDENHELYPMKGAWRAFEHGPRNCIAQGLVMTELRVVLALLVREFNFEPAYAEWDRLHPRKGLKTYRGERAYQIEEGAAHPVEHYPCKVALRKHEAGL